MKTFIPATLCFIAFCTGCAGGKTENSISDEPTMEVVADATLNSLKGRWQVVSFNPITFSSYKMTEINTNPSPVIEFDNIANRFCCTTGDNNISGSYNEKARNVKFDNLVATEKWSEHPEFEISLRGLLPGIVSYEIQGETAYLIDVSGHPVIQLQRARPR